jgi:Protein of unknown function (DUF4231)
LNSTPVIGAGTRPAGKNRRFSLTREPKAIRQLRAQLYDMGNAAEPFLTDEPRKVYWAQAWELAVVNATTRVEGNRKEFYGLRLVAIISAITVPSLVGLNLSGTGGSTVRWLTFALSLIAAVSTAIITLFRFADRWLMYRTLSNSLMSAGWALVNSPDTNPDAWDQFTAATDAAKAKYNATYQTAVILAAEPSVAPQQQSRSPQ